MCHLLPTHSFCRQDVLSPLEYPLVDVLRRGFHSIAGVSPGYFHHGGCYGPHRSGYERVDASARSARFSCPPRRSRSPDASGLVSRFLGASRSEPGLASLRSARRRTNSAGRSLRAPSARCWLCLFSGCAPLAPRGAREGARRRAQM